jgi:hypothetical protein
MMIADKDASREYWLEQVRPVAERGKLDKIPTRLAVTKREKQQAKTQNYWLTKRTFGGFHPNYDNIKW